MVQDLYTERKKILAQLEALRIFPNTKTVRQLRHELEDKLERIERKISKLERERDRHEQEDEDEGEEVSDEVEDIEDEEGGEAPNLKRSRFMKNRHRFVRLVHSKVHGTPDEMPYAQISHWVSVSRRGGKTPIDAVFANLSG